MAIEVVMPKFGLTMQEGTIQQWHKAEGERIAASEPLFEVETEKVLYEVESPASGTVATILYPVEATVPIGTVVVVIAEDGENPAEIGARYRSERETASRPAERGDAHAAGTAAAPDAAPGRRPAATPVARKLARAHSIDLATLTGTGPGGRITREDVEAAIAGATHVSEGSPFRGMRKLIAARMIESLHTAAQLTITTEADVTPLAQRRQKGTAEPGVTYTDLIVAAVTRALATHPRLNATVDGDRINVRTEINIGIAVALDDGLITPVIRDAGRKSLRELADDARRLAERARTGTLAVDDVTGGTFTVTNLGMYGVDAFTPILQLPQVAILGVGRVKEKPAVHDGAIAIRHLTTLSLTFDHRVVDGAPAAAFLQAVVRHLQEADGDQQ